jgi:hypothetical protein
MSFLIPSSSSTTIFYLPPSRAAFVSPHLFFFGANGVAVIVFRSFFLFLPVLFPSCLVFLSSHFMDDEETEKDRVDKLRGTGGTMTAVVFWVFFSWLVKWTRHLTQVILLVAWGEHIFLIVSRGTTGQVK